MAPLRFAAPIEIVGINPYVLVSARRAAKLKSGWRKPMPVLVRVNGKPEQSWPINMMPLGDGSFRLYLHETVRRACGKGVGDRVRVEVQFNSTYKNGPQHSMPRWFRAALKSNAVASRNWERLIPSRKKEILRYFSALKSSEARERNLVRALRALSGEPTRFMARSWTNGK